MPRKGFTPGDPRASACGVAGGRAAGLKRKRALLRTFLVRWPLLSPDIMEAIYTYGQTRYFSGAKAKWRARKRADQRGVAA